MNKLSYVIFALILVLIFTFVLWNDLAMIFNNLGIFVAVISIMIVGISLIIFANYKKEKKEYELRQKIKKAQDRLSPFITTNKRDNKITISKRDADWKYFLPIEKMSNTKVKYNPASITYTGVTIGGITTGRVDYEDEHLSLVSSKRTGKAMLKCVNFTDAYYVHKITLTGDALEDAKKSSLISRYLQNDTIHGTAENFV